jgi:Tfp pilus assembly protein PilF
LRALGRKKLLAGALAVALLAGACLFLLVQQRRTSEALALERAGRALDQHDPARAIALLDELLRRNPGNREALFARAEVAHNAGDYNTARNEYLRLLFLDPQRSDARARLFDLTFQAGVLPEAEHHLAKLEALLGEKAPEVQKRRQLLEAGKNR